MLKNLFLALATLSLLAVVLAPTAAASEPAGRAIQAARVQEGGTPPETGPPIGFTDVVKDNVVHGWTFDNDASALLVGVTQGDKVVASGATGVLRFDVRLVYPKAPERAGWSLRLNERFVPEGKPLCGWTIDYPVWRLVSLGCMSIAPEPEPEPPATNTLKQRAFDIAANEYGWGFEYQGSIDYVFQHESNWQIHAKNPVSTACGLGQLLRSTWANYGYSYCPRDEGSQIRGAFDYIASRYGNPGAAERFWRGNRWY